MKRKIYAIASAVLILTISLTVFSACGKDEKNETAKQSSTSTASVESVTESQASSQTEAESHTMLQSEVHSEEKKPENTSAVTTPVTKAVTTKVYSYNDNKGYTVYSYVEPTNKPTAPETAPPTKNNAVTTEKHTSAATTVNVAESPTVPEINNGITCVKTQYASRGQIVSVSVIMGTPNAEYSIDFYENETKLSDAKGLVNKKADSNGTVEWKFLIDDDCELGHRKLIIKEKGTDKYAQTFITVNG